MAWIYLAAQEDSPSPYAIGLSPSHSASATATVRLCCCQEWLLVKCTAHQSGTTLHRLALPCYQVESKLSLAGSPAKTLALWEMERVWRASSQSFTSNSGASFAKFDPHSCSWKTSQLSLFEDLSELRWTSLRWGMIQDGQLSQPANLAPRTCAKDGGYLPTPTARDYKSPGVSRSRKANVEERRGVPLSVWFKTTYGLNLHPTFVEWMMGYPLKHTALELWVIPWFRQSRKKPL